MLSGGHVIISKLPRLLALAAAVVGGAAWAIFFRAGLVLSHYDAKAHLVVARRVFDNLTPGWQQIGAVWLPLPHLIDVLPAQIDVFYRTGVFASLVSIACLAVTTYAAARLIVRVTGSAPGACASAALLIFNPNLLYLHTTPMTEPLLIAATALVVLWLVEWVEQDRDAVPPRLAAALFAAMWTRYEAWPIVAAAVAAAGYATWRRGASLDTLARRGWRVVVWPALAVVIFLINSRITVGAWFVSEGFYVPDPSYANQPLRTVIGIWWGTHQLSGYVMEIVALATAAFIAWRALAREEDAPLLITLALFAAAAVPAVAFYEGHPYRIRYMLPMVAACAIFSGLAVGLLGQRRPGPSGPGRLAVALALVASPFIESPPWNMQAPMLLEAQWDRGASMGRRDVTACLVREYRGDKVVASMGSLAHYMQELSNNGFGIADFINEGNGEIWNLALQTGPAPHAGWMLVEEVAKRDPISRTARLP
ncbi:MAG: hypothetical protein DMF87_18715 [Acidobacteria bacterium]|nr:MAG: hypothetical protein DMF87_18715 [Acidobacteriota bacterium]